MHDYFDIVGLPSTARPVDVRLVCARHVRRCHPDFQPQGASSAAPFSTSRQDAAVDFAEMSGFVDRIQASFFHSS